MKFYKIIVLISCLLFFRFALFAQSEDKKTYTAIKTEAPPEIDGVLNDSAWLNTPVATDFIQYKPYNGKAASYNSSVKIVYDDEAIYVGAVLYDPSPGSILTELSHRDEANNVSSFGLYLDPFNDGSVAYGFFVTAAGVQIDRKMDVNNSYFVDNGDNSWDAVWYSEIKINGKGWVAEFKIPYSALRFPKKNTQEWGLNIVRIIKRHKEQTTWNYIDTEISDMNTQSGVMEGIKNIEPPVRLSFIPYASVFTEKISNENEWAYSYKGGMDLKYGISESFTLDMILIPDFGHVQSDDKVFSLDPYEVYYGEKRPFFTEGTELFEKGNVIYTRRIGAQPSGYVNVEDSLNINEKIDNNPEETQLLNAIKISGKTKKGLGIGFFNAITANTHASLWDTITGKKREVLTEPLSNYNMIVLDQSLKNNSYISLFNTNVARKGKYPTANVTGTQFRFLDNSKVYALQGNLTFSQKYNLNTNNEIGSKYYLEASKVSGNFKYSFLYYTETDKYDPNDMGFDIKNNESIYRIKLEYDIYEPVWKIIESYNELQIKYSSLYAPHKFTGFEIDINSFTTFRNYLSVSFDMETRPVESHDYFEARVPGRVFIKPPDYEIKIYLSPDYRKRFVLDSYLGFLQSITTDKFTYWYGLNPRIRLNDKFNIKLQHAYAIRLNDRGYVADSLGAAGEQIIIFGKRKITNITNTLNFSYIFNNKASLSFRMRHYWLWVDYNEFFDLKNNGYLERSDYSKNNDFNYNAFNIDLLFSWEFSPGSELLLVWKNSIYSNENIIEEEFFNNLKNVFNAPNTNTFSVKVLYYLDYLMFKRKNK